MPELPEVEVVRVGLAHHVVGRTLRAVDPLHPRATRRQPGGPDEFRGLLTGRRLTGTGRRGKFLWLTTDDPDVVLAAHLGMSGQFRVEDWEAPPLHLGAEDPDDAAGARARTTSTSGSHPGPGLGRPGEPTTPHPHARIRFDLDVGRLWFLDQRTFGWVAAVPTVVDAFGVAVPTPVAAIGPDPTEAAFDARAAARRLHAHRVEVKRLLLDQGIVSGVGNIYADESLWRAGVHPRRRADRMLVRDLEVLLQHAGEVMAEAVADGGTSFDRLYVNVNGRSGYFGRGLAVYGRAGQPCPRCGTPILRQRFMNRSSHLCPRCQRPPREGH